MLARVAVAASLAGTMLGLAAPAAASERPLFVSLGEDSRPPIGWVEFCARHPRDCTAGATVPRDVVLTPRTWNELVRINRLVNEAIQPMTDLEHWGVVERWSYPDDGFGDCEDYVLLKRKLLMQAGWPRSALLITVVRDEKGDGHAVLTVKTDRGEFILDNQNERVLLWSNTQYRFVKRQAQHDPHLWIALGDPRPAVSTATSR